SAAKSDIADARIGRRQLAVRGLDAICLGIAPGAAADGALRGPFLDVATEVVDAKRRDVGGERAGRSGAGVAIAARIHGLPLEGVGALLAAGVQLALVGRIVSPGKRELLLSPGRELPFGFAR